MSVVKCAEHQLSHSLLGGVTVAVYGLDGLDRAVVMKYGRLRRNRSTLVRIQSACLYGDTLRASDCDCRGQIDDAFQLFLEDGSGLFIYLRQEGRGVGLIPKARAYERAQLQSLDTVDAYQQLDLPIDSREYSIAIEILQDLEVGGIRLITNNPRKLEALKSAGFAVRREPSAPRITQENMEYLRTKQVKLGHLLEVPAAPGTAGEVVTVVVVGAAVMDHVFALSSDPEPGKARQATRYARRPGGKGLNQAIASARLGARSSLLTVVGHDRDSEAIVSALASEGVELLRGSEADEERLSPQTAVLQPERGAPTYIGWLGEEHRTLRRRAIDDCEAQIRLADAVLMTLEASDTAIRATLDQSWRGALTLLCASPAQESPYQLQTRTLERVDVLVGSPDELRALVASNGTDVSDDGSGWEAASRLAMLLGGPTVVLADFRGADRRAVAFNPELADPVAVRSPDVRAPAEISAAVGNTDVYCAALALEIVRLKATGVDAPSGFWRSTESPLVEERNLVDVLMRAALPEAYVAASAGGYTAFPRHDDPDFQEWCSRHPPAHEELRSTS